MVNEIHVAVLRTTSVQFIKILPWLKLSRRLMLEDYIKVITRTVTSYWVCCLISMLK